MPNLIRMSVTSLQNKQLEDLNKIWDDISTVQGLAHLLNILGSEKYHVYLNAVTTRSKLILDVVDDDNTGVALSS
jgi:hypothetical protein